MRSALLAGMMCIGLVSCPSLLSAKESASGAAQQVSQGEVTVTGTVTDEKGEPLIGASVFVKGTTTGVITDLDGKFTITVPADAPLEISYIGYLSQEIIPGVRDNLMITLQPDAKLLYDVVLIGYGTVKWKDLTGSVESV